MEQHTAHESDAVAMARFAAESPYLVQVEYEFFASRDVQHKKVLKEEDEAGPSQVIKLELDDDKADDIDLRPLS